MVKLSFSFRMQIREINYKRPDVSFVGFASHAVSDAGAASVYVYKLHMKSRMIALDVLKLCQGGKAVTVLVDSKAVLRIRTGIRDPVLFVIFSFYVRYSTLLHLPPFRFHCVGGC
jgi:hypothetical protein